MVFGLCLRSLLEHQKNRKKPLQKHFKNSLLTRYLRDYLEGKKRMALILTVKSGEEDYLDASFLLRQASPFMKIKFTNSEESTVMIGNKRHFQPFLKADQQKKMKMRTIESSLVNEKSVDVVNSTPHEKECENEVTVKKVNEVYDNINASKRNRLSQIMQGFAIAAWQVLKQYKEKLKVAEKEIIYLKQSLEDESARSDRLAKELARLKSSFLCEDIVLTDKIITKEVGCRGNYLDGSAELDHQSMDSHELAGASSINPSDPEFRLNNQRCDSSVVGGTSENLSESEVTVNNRSTDFSVINSCVVGTSGVGEEIFKGHCRQKHVESPVASEGVEISEGKEDSSHKGIVLFEDTACSIPDNLGRDNISSSVERRQSKNDTEKDAGTSSGNISELEFTVNSQSIDSSVGHTPLVTLGSCVVINSVTQEISEGTCCQRIQSPGVAEDLENFESKDDSDQNDNVLLQDSANSIQPIVSLSDDSSSLVEGHQSQNDMEKKVFNETAISNEVPEVAVEVPCSKLPNAEKPKRRLQPASSMLLKNISGLDIEEENEKPKGGRGSKRNTGVDLTRKTQGSLSLIRLLKNNI
ncbi:hypothetical protein POM88_051931 [Heracleum sosnowskyi]|uniref:Kinesin motor domain-containing protein n=1 Tax=Heracleum sosnowskyi TaxID=360622 RepID=A0AAD8LY68_9APIA|nr:hypothetical protein POM88_051931 [Heracleum sosnowskyi]